MRTHSIQEILANEDVEIRVDTRIRTGIRIEANNPNILIHDKKRKEITLIKIGITSQDKLQTVKTENKNKYDILAINWGKNISAKLK